MCVCVLTDSDLLFTLFTSIADDSSICGCVPWTAHSKRALLLPFVGSVDYRNAQVRSVSKHGA